MKGALVFIVTFIIFLLITLGFAAIPPGRTIYDSLNVPATYYPVLGIPTTDLVIAVFNGVVYGVIVWLIYTIIARATKREKKQEDEYQDKSDQEERR